jgi:hypothetical protein
MNQLILEGKKKQKNIINLAMTKMPVEYFDYYSLVDRLPVAITKLMSH